MIGDRLCVLTGAASGIGRAAARQLAEAGLQLVLVDRDGAGLVALSDELAAAGHVRPELHGVDLSNMDNVRGLAGTLLEAHGAIDVLANNAGVLCERRQVTDEGFELTFAVNYLAPFLLTQLLLPGLRASEDARVVNTSSLAHGHGRINFDDLQLSSGYNLYRAYAQSKLALMLFTRALARRTEGTKVTPNCFHPGIVGTGIGEGGFNKLMAGAAPLLRKPERGAKTLVHLATADAGRTTRGEYFIDERPRRAKARGRDDEVGERLWTQTQALLNLG